MVVAHRLKIAGDRSRCGIEHVRSMRSPQSLPLDPVKPRHRPERSGHVAGSRSRRKAPMPARYFSPEVTPKGSMWFLSNQRKALWRPAGISAHPCRGKTTPASELRGFRRSAKSLPAATPLPSTGRGKTVVCHRHLRIRQGDTSRPTKPAASRANVPGSGTGWQGSLARRFGRSSPARSSGR